jgi:hypothetical protein
MFDTDKTAVMAGTIPSTDIHVISDSIGLVASKTLITVSLPVGVAQGLNRNIAIWQGAEGLYVSDGRSPIPIHDDITRFFDSNDALCIDPAYLSLSSAFIDIEKMEYHWVFYSGSSHTKREFVFSLRYWKWFEIDRGASNDLVFGIPATSTYGKQYTYGFTSDSHMHRLEYGTTFNGTAISWNMLYGDLSLSEGDDPEMVTRLLKVGLVGVAKSVDVTSEITCTQYNNTATVGTAVSFGTMQATGYRTYHKVRSFNVSGALHAIGFSGSSSTEVCAFEPLKITTYFQNEYSNIKEA